MNLPRKKLVGLSLGRSRSNPHLPVESGASEVEPSSLPPSRNASPSRRGLSGLRVPKFWGKHSSRSARQSPSPEPAAASFSAQDLLSAETTQDSSLTAPTPTVPTIEPNPDQASDSGIPKVDSIIVVRIILIRLFR
ncbi:uncharacterized protein EDB91DRAFT_1081681 [Suillus paluster]|uniref:uncharacterized protein n=1 Tax=Suillus paluster TaxID=48578 RepID=UPI001B85C616|nr:uncharacterized protein EDB91DRAFT_1081681 [Suillus paluster]KAG1741890.1 hypothetical protein EDB91DRAFT_1081681 [Suillus paluster]